MVVHCTFVAVTLLASRWLRLVYQLAVHSRCIPGADRSLVGQLGVPEVALQGISIAFHDLLPLCV